MFCFLSTGGVCGWEWSFPLQRYIFTDIFIDFKG